MTKKLSEVNVLVVGDAILDEYVYGTVERISPEAPVMILDKKDSEFRLGGAANVAANCAKMGAKTTLMSAVGEDIAADILRRMCQELRIKINFLTGKKNHTPAKTRFVSNGHQILRVDRESKEEIGPLKSEKSKEYLSRSLDDADVIIVSDYNKGYISRAIVGMLVQTGKPVIVDPKSANIEYYEGVTLITPNKKEAAEMLGVDKDKLDDHLIMSLTGKLGSDVLVTLGEEGMKYCKWNERPISFPAVAQEVFDVTGAGDTVISVISLAIGAGMEMKEACKLANKAAAQVVAKFGTVTVDLELLEL